MLRLLTAILFVLNINVLAASAADSKPLNVGCLVLDHVYNSELMAPFDIFHHTIFHTKPGMKLFTISLNGGQITTFEGLKLETDFSLENAPAVDILVIPSAEHNMDTDLKNQKLKEWVKRRAESARFVVTLCDGAFVLANTGLLDGKEATTFPSDVEAFKEMFPNVRARGKVIVSFTMVNTSHLKAEPEVMMRRSISLPIFMETRWLQESAADWCSPGPIPPSSSSEPRNTFSQRKVAKTLRKNSFLLCGLASLR